MITKQEKEALVKEVMHNFPEAAYCSCLVCEAFHYKKCIYVFVDTETGKRHTLNIKSLVRGFDALIEEALRGKYKNDGFPAGALDAGNWDGLDSEALVQCAIFGKVVYG